MTPSLHTHENPFISPLPRPTSTRIRSSTIIPSFPQILSEIVQNSLDAGSTTITCWLDLQSGNEGISIRVEDDGSGIERGKEGMRMIGERYGSSKDRNGGRVGPMDMGGYGFRGEALASIAALGQVEISSKTSGSNHTYTKIIRASKVIFQGVSNRTIHGSHGTIVTVKDLFHNVPVRQAALAATSSTTNISACKKVIETLALARPGVRWSLYEERGEGPSVSTVAPKRVLTINACRSSVDIFRAVHGNALVEKVQNVRVTSGQSRVDGFISLRGALSKSYQFLYVNRFPIERGELHSAITKRFSASRFSVAMQDDFVDPDYNADKDKRRSPRRLERYPIYVLNVTLPSEDVDASYEPRKRILGYRDGDALRDLLLAVVDEYIRRHGFSARTIVSDSPVASPTKRVTYDGVLASRTASTNVATRTPHTRDQSPASAAPIPRSLKRTHDESRRGDNSSRVRTSPPATPLQRAQTPRIEQLKHSGWMSTGRKTIDTSGGKRHDWIDQLVQSIDTGVLPFSPCATPSNISFSDRNPGISPTTRGRLAQPIHHRCTPLERPSTLQSDSDAQTVETTTRMAFTKESLQTARVIAEIDSKFVCCVLDSDSDIDSDGHTDARHRQPRGRGRGLRTLVLIDQHAADERISIEAILRDLCLGFIRNDLDTIELNEPLGVVLTGEEVGLLAQEGASEVFRRWGIGVSQLQSEAGIDPAVDGKSRDQLAASEMRGEMDYIQVAITHVPTTLKARLGKKGGMELSRLVKLYLEQVLRDSLEELRSLCRSLDSSRGLNDPGPESEMDRERERDWATVLRWMPKEMLDLANSKACRGAIMFGDRLTHDQCTRLVYQLSQTRLPFQCAHGRPSLVPLTAMGDLGVGAKSKGEAQPGKVGRRRIDWGAWKDKHA